MHNHSTYSWNCQILSSFFVGLSWGGSAYLQCIIWIVRTMIILSLLCFLLLILRIALFQAPSPLPLTFHYKSSWSVSVRCGSRWVSSPFEWSVVTSPLHLSCDVLSSISALSRYYPLLRSCMQLASILNPCWFAYLLDRNLLLFSWKTSYSPQYPHSTYQLFLTNSSYFFRNPLISEIASLMSSILVSMIPVRSLSAAMFILIAAIVSSNCKSVTLRFDLGSRAPDLITLPAMDRFSYPGVGAWWDEFSPSIYGLWLPMSSTKS